MTKENFLGLITFTEWILKLKNEDYIVFFENMLSIDRDYFFENHKKNATFSNYGFYMFLLKLSLHFTRIQEKVDRG